MVLAARRAERWHARGRDSCPSYSENRRIQKESKKEKIIKITKRQTVYALSCLLLTRHHAIPMALRHTIRSVAWQRAGYDWYVESRAGERNILKDGCARDVQVLFLSFIWRIRNEGNKQSTSVYHYIQISKSPTVRTYRNGLTNRLDDGR